MSRRRIGHRQLARMRDQLSRRDTAVLVSLADWRLLTVRQIQRLHFGEHASEATANRICRRVLTRLADHNLVRHLERRIGGVRAGSAGHTYALTPLGHRLLDNRDRNRWHEPGISFVTHTLAIAELASQAVHLATQGDDYLDIEVTPEPRVWRRFHDGHSAVVLKPDLAVDLADPQRQRSWFVEVDLDSESRTVLEAKCRLYTSYWRTSIEQAERGLFPRVLWVAPDQARADHIASTFTRPGIEPRLFQAIAAEHAPLLLAGITTHPNEEKGEHS